MSRATWQALALDRILGCDELRPFARRLFSSIAVDDDVWPGWEWLATAPARSVRAWCRRMAARDWRLGIPRTLAESRGYAPWLFSRNGRGSRRRPPKGRGAR